MPVPRPTPASRLVSPKSDPPPLVPASDVQLSPSERARARVGRLVRGKWRLDELLGVGGTSAVYAATHRNRGRAAIKMLHPELSGQPSIRGCFLREGYAANGVPHAGVVRILDDDVAEDGSVFLVMDLLEGETLASRIEKARGPLSMDETLRVADGILDVLSAAHAQGIQHRDVTPKNVWITPSGEVRLIDFGSAFVAELSHQSGVTMAGQPMGTPAFMAPELARGRLGEVDARSDVYAVGAVMWAMLTGRAPRRADTINEELLAAMTEPLPAISSARPELPGAIRALVDRALAFDKEERWHSASAMREMLSLASDAVRPPETAPDLAAVVDDCARTVEVRGPYPGALAAAADSSLEITLEPTRVDDRVALAPAPFDEEPESGMNPLFGAQPRLPSIPPDGASGPRPARSTPETALRAMWIAPPPSRSRAGRVVLAAFAVLVLAAIALVIVDREAFPIFARGRALVQQMR